MVRYLTAVPFPIYEFLIHVINMYGFSIIDHTTSLDLYSSDEDSSLLFLLSFRRFIRFGVRCLRQIIGEYIFLEFQDRISLKSEHATS